MKNIILALLLFPTFLIAQELNATVTMNVEQLTNQSKERLDGFTKAIENYLNNNRYTSDYWENEKIKCNFNIFFTGSADETSYSAQVVITSQRPVYGAQRSSLMLNVRDENWDFKYESGQPMYFDPTNFNPLLSFLDFYAYVIIGLDFDSYEPLSGSPFFAKAMEIGVLGANSGSSNGWQSSSSSYNRRGLVDDLSNTIFQQFRQDYFDYHYNGIDIFFKYPEEAQKNFLKLINNLAEKKDKLNPRSVLMKTFFDAKSGEIVEYLKSYREVEIFEKLKKIDPPHTAKYNEAIDART